MRSSQDGATFRDSRYSFLMISREVSVNFGWKGRLNDEEDLENKRRQRKSRLRLEGRGIATRADWEESISILRAGKSKFEKTTDFAGGGSSPIESGLNAFGWPDRWVRFCKFILPCSTWIHQPISRFHLSFDSLFHIISLSLLVDDRLRHRGSLFTPVISASRHSLNLPSALTEVPLKNSFRSSLQLCLLSANFDCSKVTVRSCWVMINCSIVVDLCLIVESVNECGWKGLRRHYRETVTYWRGAPRGASKKQRPKLLVDAV